MSLLAKPESFSAHFGWGAYASLIFAYWQSAPILAPWVLGGFLSAAVLGATGL